MIRLSYEQKEDIGLKYVRDMLDPASPYGVKFLKAEGFYGQARQQALEEELNNIALLWQDLETQEAAVADLQHALSELKDLSGTFANGMTQALTEVELFELSAYCRRMQELRRLAEALPSYPRLAGTQLEPVEDALRVLDPADSGLAGFYIEDARTPELAEARAAKRAAELQLRTAPEEGREALLKQRQEAARREEDALQVVYAQMSADLRPHLPLLQRNAAAAGRLDAGIAKSLLARRFGCVRPEMGGEDLVLEEAVHPQVAAALSERGRTFTPITMTLSRGVTVLTGANMGGKSIALKTALLNAALALSGCFVFARSARVPFFDRIEVINRDFSNASQGLSSFGGEILRLKEALEDLREGGLSLIVMDELARGTNAREGAQIARGTVNYLADKNAVTLLATHYDGAAEGAVRHYQVKGLARREDASWTGTAEGRDGLRLIENAMDYGLIEVKPGTECPRDAIAICRLLGLPEEILS
ncbi:MAG: hypothetical protein J5493_05570 [Lachnospiraceae bacterium]|nr:hypothetical protein [Lachnospiraceae bacterium]